LNFKKRFEQIDLTKAKETSFGFFSRISFRRKIEMSSESLDEDFRKKQQQEIQIQVEKSRERRKLMDQKKAQEVIKLKNDAAMEKINLEIEGAKKRKDRASSGLFLGILGLLISVGLFFVMIMLRAK